MEHENPYQATADDRPPTYDVAPPGKVWREGNVLVLEHDARLPQHCIYCNSGQNVVMVPQTVRYRPFLPWHHAEQAHIQFGLCRSCRRRRWLAHVAVGILAVGPFLLLLTSPKFPRADVQFPVGLVWISITSALLLKYWFQLPTSAHIDAREIRIRGLSSDFLADLPLRDEEIKTAQRQQGVP
jgi:hypothetical protein